MAAAAHNRVTATWLATALLSLAIWMSAACGAGEGTAIFLPAGPQTSAPPGNVVLYAAEAKGNRLVAYRPGTDGLLPAAPFDLLTVDNPRRLLVAGSILYVTTGREILSIALGANGSLPAVVTARTLPIQNADIFSLHVVGDLLYAAFAGTRQIRVFRLLADGHVPESATAAGGTFNTDYRSFTIFGGFLYAAARGTARVDTFRLAADGTIPDEPEVQDPATFVSVPDRLAARDGMVYVAGKGRRRIFGFRIMPNGLLPNDPTTTSGRAGSYEDLLFDGDTVYAAAFNEGRIDTFIIDPADGSLGGAAPIHSTRADATSFPTDLAVHNGVLYVAQAGSDRVDAYLLGVGGVPPEFPSSSTVAVPGSFPTGLALFEHP